MKKALIVAGAAAVLGTSRKPMVVQPCSKNLQVVFYSKGKIVRKEVFKDGNWFVSNKTGLRMEGIAFTDSVSVDIVPEIIK